MLFIMKILSIFLKITPKNTKPMENQEQFFFHQNFKCLYLKNEHTDPSFFFFLFFSTKDFNRFYNPLKSLFFLNRAVNILKHIVDSYIKIILQSLNYCTTYSFFHRVFISLIFAIFAKDKMQKKYP